VVVNERSIHRLRSVLTMGCGNSKSTRVTAESWGKHTELTGVLKAAERLRGAVAKHGSAFSTISGAVALWASEEDGSAVRDAGSAIKAKQNAIEPSLETLRNEVEAFVQTFNQIMVLNNSVDRADREATRSTRAADKAREKLERLERKETADTIGAKSDALAAADAEKEAVARLAGAVADQAAQRPAHFTKGLRDLTTAMVRHNKVLAATYREVAEIAAALPATEATAWLEGGNEPRPRGRPSLAAASYKNLKAVTKGWERYSKATADAGSARHALFEQLAAWGVERGGDYKMETDALLTGIDALDDAIAGVAAAATAAARAFRTIEAEEREVDVAWKAADEEGKALSKETRRLSKITNSPAADDAAKADAKAAVDEATTVYENAVAAVKAAWADAQAKKLAAFKEAMVDLASAHRTAGETIAARAEKMGARIQEPTEQPSTTASPAPPVATESDAPKAVEAAAAASPSPAASPVKSPPAEPVQEESADAAPAAEDPPAAAAPSPTPAAEGTAASDDAAAADK